ncbi:MAG: hypothetical protein A2W72_16720 [Burkholderiales bacterium RIFCSPLOWO2_12_67_14]|nr:MAG: hypothetical protein A3I64_02610 [Burkholderiales bacterium RIFCSPLOWO2_02_FULL_67_64]OGB38210.1 MAG: hypothetical protein A3E51_24845 [Burkholderiales bacterium RIFCSPHIGHO2_12_FULL_67_38]OGB39124.1 MAG: hypothetical protein A2W72_16720 [Burkholderiales bacterium RIFCSPLOWO2_12_67_14]
MLNKFFASCVLALGMAVVLPGGAQAASPRARSDLTPVGMRSIWYPKTEAGAQQCARYVRRRPVELDPGALQIGDQNIMEWGPVGQHKVVFVVDVRAKRRSTWRLQGLLDTYPYEAPKVLETYVFEVRKDELRWSRRVVDLMTERVETSVYVRCV